MLGLLLHTLEDQRSGSGLKKSHLKAGSKTPGSCWTGVYSSDQCLNGSNEVILQLPPSLHYPYPYRDFLAV